MNRAALMQRQPPRQTGFTLIEMVAVLAIVGLLAAAAVPLLELSARRAQELVLRQSLRELRTAIDAYRAAAETGRIVRPASESTHPHPTNPQVTNPQVTDPHATGAYPATLDILVQGAPVADDKGLAIPGARLYLLRRLPRDPFADPALPAAQTWGLRASDSPPDAPAAGRDVFDVYSRSERQALDGTRYRDW